MLFSTPIFTDQKKADVKAGVAAEKGTDTGIGTRTGGDGTALDHVPGQGLAPETTIVTETEIVGKEETSRLDGLSVHPAPEKTKKRTLTGGRTNTWTGLLQRSPLLVTSTMAKSPASCSLDALSSWRGSGQLKITNLRNATLPFHQNFSFVNWFKFVCDLLFSL